MGLIFVISAPSGAGKTSLVQAVLEKDTRVCKSISHTTRAKRSIEVPGEAYHFVTDVVFDDLRDQGAFLESAQVFGAQYGTAEAVVMDQIVQGKDVILEIDWQGAQQVSRRVPCVRIFILPPSLAVLEERLTHRGQDSPEVIQRRLSGAKVEMQHYAEYDYLVFNEDFEVALAALLAIIEGERCRTQNSVKLHADRIAALLAIDKGAISA